MRLTVVGSGTAAPEPDRVCSGYWVEAGDTRLLLDCGPGVVQRMAALGLPWWRLDHLLVSHFHNDHLGDLPMLLFALKHGAPERRTDPLTLWAPHGIQDRLRAMRAAFGDHVEDPGLPLLVREATPGDVFEAGITVVAAETPHTPESLAYRLEDDDACLGYTGDTGPSPELAAFLAGCDLIIAECSLPDHEAIDTHLSPRTLAALAREAAPGKLLVTHVYPQLDRLGACERVRAAGWQGETIRATDGLVLTVAAEDPPATGMDGPTPTP
jgi:ribonuclease BN (tRNA processing enzyme)